MVSTMKLLVVSLANVDDPDHVVQMGRVERSNNNNKFIIPSENLDSNSVQV